MHLIVIMTGTNLYRAVISSLCAMATIAYIFTIPKSNIPKSNTPNLEFNNNNNNTHMPAGKICWFCSSGIPCFNCKN